MIVCNINVEDGLVNGASGLLKYISINEKINEPEILWFHFLPERVGLNTRLNGINHNDINIDKFWTPIYKKITLLKNHTFQQKGQVTRTQFPIVAAEAMTIHKSQGQSYNEVCVSLNGRITKSMLYVALSRVASLSGLYILGKFKPSTFSNKQ